MTRGVGSENGRPVKVDAVVGANLRTYRLMRGLSQKQIADRIGKSAKQYRKYEAGSAQISVATLVHLSELLNIPVAALFYRTLPNPTPKDWPELEQTIAVAKSHAAIEDPKKRAILVALIREIEASQHR